MARGAPLPTPEEQQAESAEFRAALSRNPNTHFIARRDGAAVGLFELRLLGSAVDLRRLYLLDGLMGTYGSALLARAVEEARRHGRILTVESIPAAQSRMYIEAGFTVNTRTRMVASLADYIPMSVMPPEGVTLRPIMLNDEPLFARMAYEHYKGTVDAPMVSRSTAQAETVIRPIFHNEYALLEPSASRIALDQNGHPEGGILVACHTTDPADRLAWVLDISIAERWRGRGLGKALMYTAFNAVYDLGFRRIGLMVTEANETAIRFYRSLGFESYGDTLYEAWIELE
ncbi:MAG TPA: GNAT family N-acetyltransferase [Chloroflexia bacterium]|nr:GNAT family N-acetyltransferase [Chloroflexia bacterium]